MSLIITAKEMNHVLGTPPLDNPCKDYLLGIVSNEWPDLKDNTTVVAIRAHHDMGNSHAVAKWLQDACKRYVVELLPKEPELV